MAERGLDRDLALARQALRGPAAMKARVRLRLDAEAGLAPSGGLPASASEPRRHTPAPLLRELRRRPRLATVTLLLGLSFGAGFWLGQRPNTSSPRVELPGAATPRVVPAGGEAALAETRSELAAVAATSASATNASATSATSPSQTQPRAARPPRARDTARSPGSAASSESRWRASVEGRESDALAGEVALLERTERAIRKGNAALALGLLAELDEKFPAAALPEERRAARVLARCAHDAANGDSADARALAQRFLAESPASVYAARIREACSVPSATIGGVRLREPVPAGH